jgi:GT2 family glycosyltransferase
MRLLKELCAQTYPCAQFEVLIVDDGSTDGTVDALRRESPPYALRVLEQPHGGPAAARNLGVQQARGTIVVFLDDDVVPDRDLLATHMAAHEGTLGAVVVGPMCPPGDWPRSVWVRWEEEKLQLQYDAMLAGKYACTPRQFYTANASLARTQFLEVGGFDSRFKRAEDVELAFRLREHGARFVFEPKAKVLHYASRTFESWCSIPYQYGRYDVIMHREKGHETLSNAFREFHYRNWMNRVLARVCVGRGVVFRGAVAALGALVHVASRGGAHRPATQALSGLFQILYWQGVSDELGGPEQIWQAIVASAPSAA